MSLIRAGIEIEQMINFGMPRVGDDDYAAFSNNLWTTQYRMTHYKDIVPHIPPQDFPFGFRQTATEVYENNKGDYKICNGSGEDKDCSD